MENTRDTMEPFYLIDHIDKNDIDKPIKDIYDDSLNQLQNTCIKQQPIYDSIQNKKIYVLKDANQHYLSNDQWIYRNDKVMNGGKFGNIIGNDPNFQYYPLF